MSGYPPQEPPPGYTPSAYPPQGQQPMSYPQYNPGPPYPQHMQAHSASTVTVVTQPATVLRPGVCPYCGVGFPRAEFTILGIVIAFLFFPLGIICCMMMTENRCTNCHRQL